MNRLKRLVQMIQREHYLELAGHEIRIEIKPFTEDWLLYCPTDYERVHYVQASHKVSNLPEKCVVAGLAHELSHVVRDIESNLQGKGR